MEEKTVIEWFEWAEANGLAWASWAILNAKAEGDTESMAVKSLRSALLNGFIWRNSPQGAKFWIAIDKALMQNDL